MTGLSRRFFIQAVAATVAGGGLVLKLPWPAVADTAEPEFRQTFLSVGSNGRIVLSCPVTEIGQGTSTALAMILADALDADWATIGFELAPADPRYINPTFGMQLTGASTGISGFREIIEAAGASARAMLIAAAADRWGIPPADCRTEPGVVVARDGRRLDYGDLAADAAAQPVAEVSPASGRGRYVGAAVPRLDVPAKVDGSACYAIDLRLPHMLYATVVAAPVFGATLAGDERESVRDRPGIVAIVDLPNAVGIVAERWWTAHTAAGDLAPRWNDSPNDAVSDATISAQLHRDLASGEALSAAVADGTGAAFDAADTVITRTYEVPFLAHTTMEPMSCVARWSDGHCEIWMGAQRPDLVRDKVAELLGLPPEAVRVNVVLAGGGFGRRQEPDVALQAAELARAVPGRPVKLVWSREEDVQHDVYRPAGVSELSAAIAGGTVTALRHRQASPSVLPRTFPAVYKILPYDTSVADGIVPLYALGHIEAAWVRSETHVPTGMWRSVGASQTIFAIESFVDELAAYLGADAFDFRRAALAHDARAAAAFDRLGKMCDWHAATRAGRAIGLAISHKNEDCLSAQAAEVVLKDGVPAVTRVWTVADPGELIAPDIAKAQIEGAAIWALTAALYGKITIADGRVQESNFDTYEMVRLADTPVFETEFLESGAEIEGIGEGGAPGVAPAVTNAIFRLSGRRIRTLPILPHFL